MASISTEEPSEPLKYQTLVLKVPNIQCEGCKRKVKKVLHKVDGVYTISIDSLQQRVIVNGNVEVQTLLKRLIKTGKQAEIWPENPNLKENKLKDKDRDPDHLKIQNRKVKLMGSTDGDRASESKKPNKKGGRRTGDESPALDNRVSGSKFTEEKESKEPNKEGGSLEDYVAGVGSPALDNRVSGNKKKKSKGQKGNHGNENGAQAIIGSEPHHQSSSVDLNRTRQNYFTYPPAYYCYPPLVQIGSYGSAYGPSRTPNSTYCHVQSTPYTYANGMQSTSLGGFEIFSDENINGCYVM